MSKFWLIGFMVWLWLAGPQITMAESVRWSGTVRLTAPMTIQEGETLEVDPGTVVILDVPDQDGDGIGDGRLVVNGGKVIIQGTEKAPVVFTSPTTGLEKGGWFEIFIADSPQVLIRAAVFEHAYWPVHIHDSTAVIESCRFHRNYAGGLRFQGGEVRIERNRFEGGKIGIRFHDAAPTIVDNQFQGPDKGIFFTKGVERGTISGNRFACGEYDLQMGFFQEEPVMIGPNLFVRTPSEELDDRLFDRRQDSDLKEIIFTDPPQIQYVEETP